MDIKTLILALAIGNFVFGLELILFELREERSRNNPFRTAAKILQCAGWLLLYSRGSIPDLLYTPVGNSSLLGSWNCRLLMETI